MKVQVNQKNHIWSVYFEEDGYTISGKKLMGRQAAGHAYLRAMMQSDMDCINIYLRNPHEKDQAMAMVQDLLPPGKKMSAAIIPYERPDLSAPVGGIFYPGPSLAEAADLRSFYGHDQYSLIGITHTTSSKNVMQQISNIVHQPVMPWDAPPLLSRRLTSWTRC